ncbi:MAG: hypothetical protein ABIZ36_04995 [Gemmatimonadaceae bacterium]
MGLVQNRDEFATAVAEYAGLVNDLDSVLRTPAERRTREGELVDDKQRRRAILRRARELRHSLDSLSARISNLEQAAHRSEGSRQASAASNAALKATVNQLTEMRDRQTAEIDRMTKQYDALAVVSASHEQAAATFQAALADVAEQQESVYVAIGTAKELTRRGVVRKRGGVIGLGSTLVPVLPFKPELFQARRMSGDTVIVFPDSSGVYRVLTGQNSQAVLNHSLGHLKGSLVIENPKLFWRDSRFLVVVKR